MSEIKKSNLSARRLGEPQRPVVGEWVLDVKVVGIVEDGDDLLGASIGGGGVAVLINGNGVQRDGRLWHLFDFGHDGCDYRVRMV